MNQQKPIDPIQPTDIPLTRAQPASDSPPSRSGHKPAMLIGLAATVLLALAVIFVLPQLVSPPDLSSQSVASQQQAAQPAAAPTIDESPWSQAQLAQARRDAQDVLANLLELQKHLQDKAVQQWAAERYQQGLDTANEADLSFRNREFDSALQGYQQALTIFTELEQQIAPTLNAALQAGAQAIDDGQAEQARQQYNLALAIDATNQTAMVGLDRANVLEQVLTTLEQADIARENNQLEQAREYINTALTLDSQHKGAQSALASVNQQIHQRDYIEALSQGYSHLENGQLKNARTAFNKALKLQPDSREARQGLVQADNKLTRLTLQQQLKVAAEREQQENWQAAESLYNQILNSDSSVVEARSGQIRSSVRAQLDEKLQALINNSMRLTSSNVYTDAKLLLQQARAIKNRGTRLNKQIAVLQTALIKAATLWPVEFQSDNATNVTLFRVGQLGRFDSKSVKLKPGRYVATGSRKGYRDIRVEFTITGTQQSGPIIIKCKDII